MKGMRGIFRGGNRNGTAAASPPSTENKKVAGGELPDNAVPSLPMDGSMSNLDASVNNADWSMDDNNNNKGGRRAARAAIPRVAVDAASRPVYHVYDGRTNTDDEDDENAGDVDDHTRADHVRTRNHNTDDHDDDDNNDARDDKAKHIEKSAGTNRLNRILSRKDGGILADDDDPNRSFLFNKVPAAAAGTAGTAAAALHHGGVVERVADPKNLAQVANFAARVVIPPLRVDKHAIGGATLEGYPENMQQETLLCFQCQSFELTGQETVALPTLQYPGEFKKHKRNLGGGFAGGGLKGRSRLRYILVVRSTNKPCTAQSAAHRQLKTRMEDQDDDDDDGMERGDYDAMFIPEATEDEDLSMSVDTTEDTSTVAEPEKSPATGTKVENQTNEKPPGTTETNPTTDATQKAEKNTPQEEVSSFPMLVCMTLHSSGTAPDIRKLIRLDQLTTVQDLHATVVQLAFRNGDTIRLDFGTDQLVQNRIQQQHQQMRNKEYQEGSLEKERFVWSLLQIHAMLCVSVVERSALNLPGERTFLPPLSVLNMDRAELQYVATVNGFLRKSETLTVLLERHKRMLEHADAKLGTTVSAIEEKVELDEVNSMAYDLLMGNLATRITLFQSEEERKDAEDILNSIEWSGNDQGGEALSLAVLSIAEQLGLKLQERMRDLEAETCRRLIAWEDEKHLSRSGTKAEKNSMMVDERDSVDQLALASLFQTLESLDTELLGMEEWLQQRVAAIKPLTDDCADIEEENRQLEQQWKSYETLGSEIRRLLIGLDMDEDLEAILKNPAQSLVYDESGLVDIEECEQGLEQIYDAGKALQDAIEYPQKSGGMHLRCVNERSKGLTSLSAGFCKQLAQIIVTVMEQFKTEVVAGSDHGKVSKSDTHAIIARKIRDTQRKFQSSLLGYLKLIEILAALCPEMLPALRDAYSEMVAEGILMKKRMKGYFLALPGKGAAYLARVGKDIKDYYVPVDNMVKYESVNAPDIKAALTELLPVIAREAYFTSALFGTSKKEQDGREKKRNFENTKAAVDHSSQHFRYYINRTCGIPDSPADVAKNAESAIRGDPLLCLVASIYLNEVMDNYVDREKKGGDHSLSLAYVRATILDLRKKADKQWVNWVEQQIEWIRSNDGIPLHGKRAGVFPSFARFPLYLDHVLYCCREGRSSDYTPDMSSIKVINYYMQKMASALLDSLRDCATRESTDKQYASTVMQMENTYHFTQCIKERGPAMEELFSKQLTKANAICKESTDAYLGWMIKREFTVLHDLFSRVSKMRKDVGDSEVAKNIPKHQFVRTLTKEANRDILKEKIGSMYSRMEKHLSEDGKILPVAWKALVKVLYEWFGRWENLSSSIYRHKLDPSPVDVVRIAKAAGGGGKPKPQTGGSEFAFKSILALGNKGNGGDGS